MGRRIMNQLPLPRPQFWRPGPKSTDHLDPDEKEHVLNLASDGLLCGLAAAQGMDMPPIEEDDPTYKPAPGRGLWNLTDLLLLEPELDLSPYLALALRPRSRNAALMTPRMGLHVAGLRVSEAIKLQRILNDRGIIPVRPSNQDGYLFFYGQNYGPDYDRKVDTLRAHLMPGPNYLEPPRNSKRNRTQQYLLEKERDYPPAQFGKLSFPVLAMRHAPTEVDLGPKLHQLFDRALTRLRSQVRRAKKQGIPDHLRHYFEDFEEVDMHLIEHQVLNHYLIGQWCFENLYNDSLPLSEYLITALTRCMVQEHFTSALWRYQQPALLLTVSIASGVSPSVFVKSAIDQISRTGMSYLADSHPTAIADMVRMLPEAPPAAQTRRNDLVEELDELQLEMNAAVDRLDPMQVEEVRLAASGDNCPAWGLGDPLDDDD